MAGQIVSGFSLARRLPSNSKSEMLSREVRVMPQWKPSTSPKNTSLRLLTIASLAFTALALAPRAFSQSCALCYTQAASSGQHMIQALRSGILILIVPPTLMWLVLAAIAYRKRNQFKHADNLPSSASDW
jgi:hypothetical protein